MKGDVVLYLTGKRHIVDSIGPEGEITFRGWKSFVTTADLVAPAPIDEDFLRENGFVCLGGYSEKWRLGDISLNVYSHSTNGYIWRFCFKTDKNEDIIIYVSYIHELQHALKLCGIDKQIII